MINDQYTVIGNPIAHSLSPFIHQQFAQQTGQAMQYQRSLAAIDQFESTVRDLQQQGFKGANVTAPFKTQAYRLADEVSELAAKAQAANTLQFFANGTIYADNTDGLGFIEDLTHNLHCEVRGKAVLLLGAGGAAAGLLPPLLEQLPSELTIANRTKAHADQLVGCYASHDLLQAIDLQQVALSDYQLVINTISSGVVMQSLVSKAARFDPNTLVYDLSYGNQTTFLQWAAQAGAVHLTDGLGMLVEQAALSFYRWRGIYPDTSAVLLATRNHLKSMR